MKTCVPKQKSMKEAEKEEELIRIIVITEPKLLLFGKKSLKRANREAWKIRDQHVKWIDKPALHRTAKMWRKVEFTRVYISWTVYKTLSR